MFTYLRGGTVINQKKNILIENEYIKEVSNKDISLPEDCEVIDCESLVILPGIIDTHVHFRQPGAEYKADMQSESIAALAGGVTSVFDMPNNSPATTSIETLQEKYVLCKENMFCNYALYFGLTNDNIRQAINLPKESVAGLKLFLGSSTGNMLVDNNEEIEYLFKNSPFIITAHCEDEQRIISNKNKYSNLNPLPYNIHSLIRDEDCCYNSSSYAISLAKKHHTQFHLAHVTTGKEISLLSNDKLENKHITAEVSPNHLWFCEEDYKTKGNLIKCNPAIKTSVDRKLLRKALEEGYIDMIATDHAPHLLNEKEKDYFSAPSGMPSIQYSLLMMLEIAEQENWTLDFIVEKMCKNPAKRFHIKQRGFIEKGYFADLVLIKNGKKTKVNTKNILSKCKWSPLEEKTFSNSVEMTFLNGKKVYQNSSFIQQNNAKKIDFF
ncbi:MAG: dihydroorotase [Bacteroidales bacterium]|nr:dihydroorotase [Bacteroidales bacterium]